MRFRTMAWRPLYAGVRIFQGPDRQVPQYISAAVPQDGQLLSVICDSYLVDTSNKWAESDADIWNTGIVQ